MKLASSQDLVQTGLSMEKYAKLNKEVLMVIADNFKGGQRYSKTQVLEQLLLWTKLSKDEASPVTHIIGQCLAFCLRKVKDSPNLPRIHCKMDIFELSSSFLTFLTKTYLPLSSAPKIWIAEEAQANFPKTKAKGPLVHTNLKFIWTIGSQIFLKVLVFTGICPRVAFLCLQRIEQVKKVQSKKPPKFHFLSRVLHRTMLRIPRT